jgi:hypothetical protein
LADQFAGTDGVVAVGALKGMGGYYRDPRNFCQLMA